MATSEVILSTQDEMERGHAYTPAGVPLPEAVGVPLPEAVGVPLPEAVGVPLREAVGVPLPGGTAARRVLAWLGTDGWPIAIYLGSRLVVVLVAALDVLLTHRSLAAELSVFDGQWYLKLASHGYPRQALHVPSTLGFLPVYPLVIRAVAAVFFVPPLAAALTTAFAGGLAAAVLVQRLATIWWGEGVARRAVAVFCLFPGSVVFSMAYSECLTLPLILGCLLELRSGRWTLAGLLAGIAGAVEPAALMLFPACLAVALRQITVLGWGDRLARRSLIAPLLAPSGLAAFGMFLWAWTGTPLAFYQAQHYGWHQGDPLAILGQPLARHLINHPAELGGHLLNPSLWNGLLGTVFLVFALVALSRVRSELTPGAMVWTCAVGALTLWSVMSLTNARMLLIAFPAVIVWARALSGRRFTMFAGAEVALFVITSGLTLAGHMLP